MVVSRYSPETERQRELTPIENIRIGDSVWAFNRVTKNWEPQVVLDTFARPYDGDQVNVYF